ncbi:MAG: PTS transporter subunit IIC [Pelolinea sp.]|nr:PTS transporter subunit IIC [Pelolinea sp.]
MDVMVIFAKFTELINTFGSPIVIAIILFVICLAFKVKAKNAFMSAMFAGIGLMGFMWLINEYIPIVVPVVMNMIENTGLNLPGIDTGWAAVAMVAYSTQAGMIYLVLGTIFQLILFLTKFTNVFQPSGVWDQYSYAIWGSMVYFMTKDLFMAVAFMLILNLYVTICYEALAKRWSTYYGYQNCTIVQLHHGMGVPFAILWSWLLNKVGAHKINWKPTNIREKFGFWGDPIVMGVIIGFALGIAGNLKNLGTMAGWGSVITVAIGTAATMAIFPRVAAIFAQAFTYLAAASRSYAKEKNREEVYIGVDDASGYGETATLLAGTLFIPIFLVLTLVVPGNLFLPLSTLVGFPFTFNVHTSLNNGNIFKSLVSCTLTYIPGMLLASSLFAPWTQIYNAVPGIEPIGQGALAGNGFFMGAIQNLMMRGVFSWGWIAVAVLFVAYWPIWFWFKKNKVKIVDFIETNALMGTE